MTLVSPTQVNPGDEITASSVNTPVNQIAAVVNGNIDSDNINSISLSKLSGGTLTSPRVGTSVLDSNGNELLLLTATASAVNELTLANAATGNAPTITASGNDTNIDINLVPKGTGVLKVGGNSLAPAALGAWTTWTPTLTNFTVGTGGSAGVTAKYVQIGKTVHIHLVAVLGSSGASVGSNVSFSLPVTRANYGEAGSAQSIIGVVDFEDTGTAGYQGWVLATGSATTALLRVGNAASTYFGTTGVSSTVPFTWGAGDSINVTATYEAA